MRLGTLIPQCWCLELYPNRNGWTLPATLTLPFVLLLNHKDLSSILFKHWNMFGVLELLVVTDLLRILLQRHFIPWAALHKLLIEWRIVFGVCEFHLRQARLENLVGNSNLIFVCSGVNVLLGFQTKLLKVDRDFVDLLTNLPLLLRYTMHRHVSSHLHIVHRYLLNLLTILVHRYLLYLLYIFDYRLMHFKVAGLCYLLHSKVFTSIRLGHHHVGLPLLWWLLKTNRKFHWACCHINHDWFFANFWKHHGWYLWELFPWLIWKLRNFQWLKRSGILFLKSFIVCNN